MKSVVPCVLSTGGQALFSSFIKTSWGGDIAASYNNNHVSGGTDYH